MISVIIEVLVYSVRWNILALYGRFTRYLLRRDEVVIFCTHSSFHY